MTPYDAARAEYEAALDRESAQAALFRQEYGEPGDWPDFAFDAMKPLYDARVACAVRMNAARRAQQAQKPQAATLPGSGHYPDLLGPVAELARCARSEAVLVARIPLVEGEITHSACDDGSYHLFQYVLGDRVVAGLTLKASRPWRGYQSAEIDKVFTASSQRRKGYAARLLVEARKYFRRVKHSKDLTDAGRAWSRYTK